MRAAVVATVMCLAACTGSGAVPRADAEMATRSGQDLNILSRGRHVYTTNCTGCHALYRVADRNAEGWRDIVASMAPKAKLDERSRSDLLAYLQAAAR